MKYIILVISIFCSIITKAQSKSDTIQSAMSIGIEADVLPYATGGYYASAWLSQNHFRYRAIITKVSVPQFMLQEGFTNNNMMVYALITDYFFDTGVNKWWIGAGIEYWDAEIQTDYRKQTTKYESYIATIGGGYVFKVYRNLYINPWVALHATIATDNNIVVDDLVYKPAFLTPEGSLKIGWYFNTKHKR